MTVLILSLTTLGIAASFWRPIKQLRHSYDIGMYFIYVFSVVVASMADLRNLSISGSVNLLGYLAFVVFGSLLLQVLLARLLKIDADTKMEDVDFSGANLEGAKIEKFTAKKVIYDNKTQFPSGFDPRQYGFTKRGEKAADIKVEGTGASKKKRKKKAADDED